MSWVIFQQKGDKRELPNGRSFLCVDGGLGLSGDPVRTPVVFLAGFESRKHTVSVNERTVATALFDIMLSEMCAVSAIFFKDFLISGHSSITSEKP